MPRCQDSRTGCWRAKGEVNGGLQRKPVEKSPWNWKASFSQPTGNLNAQLSSRSAEEMWCSWPPWALRASVWMRARWGCQNLHRFSLFKVQDGLSWDSVLEKDLSLFEISDQAHWVCNWSWASLCLSASVAWFLKITKPWIGLGSSKVSAYNAGELGLIPGWGGSPREGYGNPLQ